MYLAVMVGNFVKQVVREWCPSTTDPPLPTMTDSLLAPGREVLYKRYHTGELVQATIVDRVWGVGCGVCAMFLRTPFT